MTGPELIPTAELIERLPATRAVLQKYVSIEFLGARELRDVVSLPVAVALAAVAQAHARGKGSKRVFDLVRTNPEEQSNHLLVIPFRGKVPKLVPAEDFEATPAVVIDLPELRRAILDGSAIDG